VNLTICVFEWEPVMRKFMICYCRFQIFELSTFPMTLLVGFKMWFCPAFWWWDRTIYLVLSVFISRPTSLLASNRASVFFVTVFMFSSSILTSSAQTRSWCVPFSSSPSDFLGPSWWHILKQSLKVMVIIASDSSEEKIYQMYLYFTIGFI